MEQLNEERRRQLDDFFKQQQTRAFKMAYVMTQNQDDALELVQDSMLRLVRNYAAKPSGEWRMLFYRILQNCIKDFYRRQAIRKLFTVFSSADESPEEELARQATHNPHDNPYQTLEQSSELTLIISALQTLPSRQQQTFLLRAWQEFSVSETADILSVSPGSVKTHYSRALERLRELLGDRYESL
jgi:RNA polymerase sigma-70 factor (ECF subfamily)